MDAPAELKRACAQCPWRTSNQGKPHAAGFYTMANLRRLWNEVRGGGNQQSCHLTDPCHPDHVAAGARLDSKPSECPGSVILVRRELLAMSTISAESVATISPESVKRYKKTRRGGLTKDGIVYWIVQRVHFGGVRFFGGPKLPDVDDDPAIGLPEKLQPYTLAERR